jgi:putative Holliday junction resolvase
LTEPVETPEPGLPRGARLGIDVGMARIGLAASDPDGLVATPVETVPRVLAGAGSASGKKPGKQSGTAKQPVRSAVGTTADVARIVAEAVERFAAVVYVGLPRHLSGKEGAATADARAFAGRLVVALAAAGEAAEVRLVDERMTTVSAHQALHAAGRKTKRHRSVIDQAAAVIILQSALDAERAKGERAGELVEARTVHDTHE